MRVTTSALVTSVFLAAACSAEKPSSTSDAVTPENAPPSPPPPGEGTELPNPGDQHIDFDARMAEEVAEKPAVMQRQKALLNLRYDLSDRPSAHVRMDRTKPVQAGIRVKLPAGQTWDSLAMLAPADVKQRDLFPVGFFPLPHVDQEEGGMVFPHFHIEELKRQTGRDLTRFDLDFDIPDQFLPEFPPAIYLTTRPDLGDVSQGKLLTTDNYYELFKKVLNPKQLDGLRLLVSPFAQQQFNLIDDRRSARPSLGVACFDCHANGSTNAGFHLVGDIRPQENRHRVDTPALRGVNIQRLFGSQRALKTVEDFTEFEQRAAYFDGDPAAATKKGLNFLDRAGQVQNMAELQALLDFPPAPKLDVEGKLVGATATAAELRGQDLFLGKARCATCHTGAFFTDNTMHNLQVERFYAPRMINGILASADGPIKTFTLRGIKNTPPYLHDGRLLTLEDTIEFFNLILQTRLTALEKMDLLAFLYQL